MGLQLGGDFAQGPHWFELRHAWFFHPGLAYMTSVDREAAILYGHSLGMSRLHGCIGFGLYEDYATPGVQAGFRLDLTHAGLEAYWVRKDYPALGIGFTLKTGDLLGD